MKPREEFFLSEDPITGEPFPPTPPREPIDPAAKPGDQLTVRNAKDLIKQHKGGGDAQS